MQHIVIFGAGKSSIYLIEYLLKELAGNHWKLTVLDADARAAIAKVGSTTPNAQGKGVEVENEEERIEWVKKADIVISMLPPSLHYLVAKDCLQFRKDLLTASYIDPQIEQLRKEIDHQGLLFLCEMGLDPGIDHMSAMQLIHDLQQKKARITSFVSHCGGLVAPESDNNPWHYKVSWNPRNVVLAGKGGALYREDNQEKKLSYNELFHAKRLVQVPGLPPLSYYPNRNSLPYIDLYQLTDTSTFIRTTLRYPEFCSGWKNIIDLGLTDETPAYNTEGMTLQQFFQQHLSRNGLSIETLLPPSEKNQFIYLGLNDHITQINRGRCSAAEVLQFIIEKKLALLPGDKDIIVMLHEIKYEINGEEHLKKSALIVKGEDHMRTAMAKTVGLPLAIAAKMILQKKITLKGLHIPVLPDIYDPVLKELAEHDIRFKES